MATAGVGTAPTKLSFAKVAALKMPFIPPVKDHAAEGVSDSFEEVRSHLSSSSTKQHSFDTKSVASATTFAMDEKESIRPDDSASVRAVDDEDVHSTVSRPGPFAQEADVILPPLQTILPRPEGGPVNLGARRFQTLINPPRFGDLEIEPVDESRATNAPPRVNPSVTQEEPARPSIVPISPDERLLDALASPKERLQILQLEERVLTFVQKGDQHFLELPPQNSYARLLAYKLADYYGLMHNVTEDGLSVRIFRSAELELPMTLATLAKSIPVGPAPALGPTAVKIMRRAGLNDSTAPSSAASKATSEADHSEEGLTSPTDSTPNRDKSKMTREEREAQYKAVRERIFGDFQELSISESNSTGDNSASMSRSSSSSGKKKNRRQKTPKDDSFEARSAYVPSYGQNHGHMMSSQQYQAAQYVAPAPADSYSSQGPYYGSSMVYGSTPTPAHPGFDTQMSNFHTMDARQQYPNADLGLAFILARTTLSNLSGAAYVPAVHHGAPGAPQNSTQYNYGMTGMHQQQSPWTPNQFGNMLPPPASPTNGTPWGVSSAAFGHGQHMTHQNTGISSPSGGLGGSNNSGQSLFNPQTRSFVPSNSSSRSGSRGNQRKKTSPASPLPFPSRSNFTPQAANTEDTLQKKYGAPANLPKKPPPPRRAPVADY
ncbi:uncharacterized protein AB675_9255 [Cyphellophora attinorum]|uniref:R3H domain-containing protein 2 n=1 Tax=Cyphellophora attinorum TaxID=1664694 RepID=A0A0N1P181_9EURO|nr:uncharacterized protein AB675_9255 [Phialophora attinorum]KPI41744.1 hypothetical protein AB675_9255 [Phialophora attinorum]